MGLIRLLLAAGVLVEHSAPLWGFSFAGGELSVQCFYAVSGFYMAMILQKGYRSPLAFWRNRLLRLLPMYWAILIPSCLLSGALWMVTSGRHAGLLANWKATGHLGLSALALLAVAVPFLFFQDLLFFLGNGPGNGLHPISNFRMDPTSLSVLLPVAPSWTLSLESGFYLLSPWLLRRRIGWIVLIAGLSFGLRWFLALHGLSLDPWSYRFFPSSLGYFLIGSLAWKLGGPWLENFSRPLCALAWGCAAVGILVGSPRREPFTSAFVVMLGMLLPAIFALTRKWRWDRWLGDLSFPLYLCHWPVFALTPGFPVPLRMGLALLLAAMLQATLGERVERWRHPASQATSPTIPPS